MLVGEDLHDALVELLNLILKRENLNGELVASATKFDDEVAIPLHSIASHRDVKMLNPTEEQLIKALSATKYIYDEESGLVKTGVKIERKTVILSNVPQVEEEVCSYRVHLNPWLTSGRKLEAFLENPRRLLKLAK